MNNNTLNIDNATGQNTPANDDNPSVRVLCTMPGTPMTELVVSLSPEHKR
jgi:hypothetical protein